MVGCKGPEGVGVRCWYVTIIYVCSSISIPPEHILISSTGTALPSLISALSGASIVTITDHPYSPSLSATNPNTITMNTQYNLFPTNSSARTTAKVSIRGYVWGESVMYSADTYGTPIPESTTERYDKIIMADCLWMQSQHENLVKTIYHFLDDSKEGSCAIVVAGFHTGRRIVRDFFEIATGETEDHETEDHETQDHETQDAGVVDDANGGSSRGVSPSIVNGKLKAVEIFELDIDGKRREWMSVRQGENREEAKRWCVVAVLVNR
jgi:EEF1A N-terminal glycine/lysine methyltransferase